MPRFDGTGPAVQGPRTGRGMGSCQGGMGRGGNGFGRGRFGFGGGRQFISPKNELAVLEAQEQDLEERLAMIREEKEALKKEAE